MSKLYKKVQPRRFRKLARLGGLVLCIVGIVMVAYFAFPFISFQLYLRPVFASQKLAAPIPQTTMLNKASFKSLLQSAADSLSGVDYTNAKNWYPSIQQTKTQASVTGYTLSIPKLNITNAYVSTIDNDLSKHLIQYGGTTVPPNKGTAVIFGHSTLPQLYNPDDYTTIFANIHRIQVGDVINLTVSDLKYVYRVYNITITDPTDTEFFTQNYDDNYLTIVTCTPPGTTWKRLLIKARIEEK